MARDKIWSEAAERWPKREDEGLYGYKRRLASNVLADVVKGLDPDTRLAFVILMGMLDIKPED